LIRIGYPASKARRLRTPTGSIFLEKALEFLLEARDAAAAIEDLLGAADPGRVRFRVDVEIELVAGLAPVERVWYSVPSVMTTVII
jgi:hypothetical protein